MYTFNFSVFDLPKNKNPSQDRGAAAFLFPQQSCSVSDGCGKCPVDWLFYEHLKYMPFDSAPLIAGTDATDIRQELTNV